MWHERVGEIRFGRQVSVLKLRSDEKGMVRGDYDEKALAGDLITDFSLSKDGYSDDFSQGRSC